jgi:hypothetical protein
MEPIPPNNGIYLMKELAERSFIIALALRLFALLR